LGIDGKKIFLIKINLLKTFENHFLFSQFFQNMAFQAEQKIKSQILASLGTDQIFRLLSDSEVSVLMKTLGLLRNLLSTKPHIDHIMSLHAIQIMQVIIKF
jgi:hypothetical protein